MKLPCLLLFSAVACLAAAEPEPSPAPDKPPEIWLGDPEVDINKARAIHRDKVIAAAAWETAYNLAAYDRAGTKNPNWDEDVRRAITLTTTSPYLSPEENRAGFEAQKDACARALKNGCTDPYFLEIAFRAGVYLPNSQDDQWAKGYAAIEREIAKSDYPVLRKFRAAWEAAPTGAATRLTALSASRVPVIPSQRCRGRRGRM